VELQGERASSDLGTEEAMAGESRSWNDQKRGQSLWLTVIMAMVVVVVVVVVVVIIIIIMLTFSAHVTGF
jgi:heme/copper-type cytochrome/quinol oxidase subunit 2